MPPTIQTNQTPDKRPVRGGEKRSELVCRVKYCNTLPDIPFDPKFITYPFDSTRFIHYNPTSLERNYKYDILTEHDLGVTIDLINRDLYTGEFGAQLDPADEKLLEEDILTPQDSKRSRHHARSVSWLRRTEYISTEQTRFQPQTMDKVEAKVGFSIKKNFKDETIYMDRESQIKAIDKTFEDSKLPIEKHYSKPNVVPLEILPVYPDFQVWKYPCAQVIFDSDPAPTGRTLPAQIEEMSQAMIRGVMDESGEQFVAYFLPTDETMEKRRKDTTDGVEYVDEEEYEYKMAREYNWNVKSKQSKGYEENYFLVMRPEGVYYNELETRVRLSKRRQKQGQVPSNTRLVVRHRTLNASEFRVQRFREKQLEPPCEDEEEEEEEEEEAAEAETVQTTGAAKKTDAADKSGSEKGDSDAEGKKKSDKGKGEGEGSGSDDEKAASKSSGSRNSSPASRASRSRSRSGSQKSRSRSGSRKSRSRSGSRKSRSRSGSQKSRSRSGSRKSRSRSGSRKSRSRSGSRKSRSPSGSRKSRSRSGSAAKSRSRSGSANSKSGSARSRSGSPAKSSGSASPEKAARSRSRSQSAAKSGKSSSGSGSGSSSGSGSDSDG